MNQEQITELLRTNLQGFSALIKESRVTNQKLGELKSAMLATNIILRRIEKSLARPPSGKGSKKNEKIKKKHE